MKMNSVLCLILIITSVISASQITNPDYTINISTPDFSKSINIAESFLAGDSIRDYDPNLLFHRIKETVGKTGYFSLSVPTAKGTGVLIFSDNQNLDTLSVDSLELIYKTALLHRYYDRLHHMGTPSDSTEYVFVLANDTRMSPARLMEQFLERKDEIITFQFGVDTLHGKVLLTRYGSDWIELYSIEEHFQQMLVARDTIGDYQFTYPSNGDTVFSKKFRYQGWVRDTAAVMTLGSDTIDVYSSGAFVGLFELEPGLNSYPLRITGESGLVDTVFNIYYSHDDFDPLASGASIRDNSIEPRSDLVYYQPDRIIVRFTGTTGGEARFKIPGLTGKYLPMQEIVNSDGQKAGLYEGVYQIQPDDKCNRQKVVFNLKGPTGKKIKKKSTGLISVKAGVQPVLLETRDVANLVRYSVGGEILSNLPAGIVLEGIAEEGRWWKVALSANRTAYIPKWSVERLPSGRGVPEARLYSIFSEVDSGWVNVNFRTTDQVPFKIVQGIDPQKLSVYFYRTRFQNEWTVYPDSCTLIDHFDWQAVDDDIVRFDVYLNTDQQWGYSGKYVNGRFVLKIKEPPVLNPANPFKDLTFILDAGHGGEHRGAVGPTGLCEKDVNLVYAQYLGRLLQERGARVIPTRQVDSTMSLSSRMVIAREAEGDIFLWLHNNAPGSSRNPLEVSGTSTYYTSPQNWPLARATYPHLVELGLEPFGQVHRTYYITRQTDMLIYLVEGAFMSHPEDELFMLSDENLQSLAQAVLAGLEDFLLSQIEND